MKAPHFSLPDQDGTIHSLSDYAGKWLIVYFYPKDDTPGCTKEACSFRDATDDLKKQGVAILGISKDSVASHKKFHEKYHLTYPILADESLETLKAYGAWAPKKFMGREFLGTLRNTYLIDPTGEIQKVYENVNVLTHTAEILSDIQRLNKDTL